MNCSLCGSTKYTVRNGTCRDNDILKIHECSECGLVYLNNFDHIDDNFYIDNGQAKSNDGVKIINTASLIDTQRRFDQFSLKLHNKNILDFGCGKGLFLEKLKNENISANLNSLEINKEYEQSLKEKFNHFSSLEEIKDSSFDIITMFHVLEHLPDPINVLNSLFKKLKKGGRIILEVPSADDILVKTYNCDAFSRYTYWSCHLYLYNMHTIKKLIDKTFFSIDYIKQYQRYGLANHLHWLSQGKPGGHLVFSFLDDTQLNSSYSKKLAEIGQCDTILAEIIKR